ncbi:unnamed protein product [Caenorhabditis auriculariae]|uniref:VWFA domain-containing protein n=1 Tax=Caenorhabditis auriculariae TaxID=2777116 RepID=A0A8S1GVR4_9PELO|nr:unnamed protein product [Caenorhabditis auriculariae]
MTTSKPAVVSTGTPGAPVTTAKGSTGAPGVSTTQAPVMTTTGAPAVSTMTPPPAVSTTQGAPTTTAFGNANLNFDVVFLFDGSQAAQPVFNNFTKFVSTLMVSYTVGPAAHVGIGVVAPDADDQAPMVAQLNSIQSQSILNGYLNTLGEYWGDFDHAGQLLDLNLKTVSSPDYMNPSAGYRPAINNHLIIYITATTAFDVDPTATAKSIIAKNQYGIITVGFGAAVDNTKLIAVSGGAACSFTATDFASLNNQIRPIQQKIWDANFNNGVYCSS